MGSPGPEDQDLNGSHQAMSYGPNHDGMSNGFSVPLRQVSSNEDGHGQPGCTTNSEGSPTPQEQTAPGEDFEVTWDGPNDPGNPKNMTKVRKWLIVTVVSTSSTCV